MTRSQKFSFDSNLFPAATLFLLALSLRFIRLFDLDVWLDEVGLLSVIPKSFISIWNFCKLDNYPPLFPWLLKLWSFLFPGEHALRVFTALLGSLTPPAAYFLGKELSDKRLGWLLGLACAISVSLIYYSQMIRMYSLMPLFSILSVYGLVQGNRTGNSRYFILTALANLLGFYIHAFMLLVPLVEFGAMAWIFRRALKNFYLFAICHIPAFVLMAFWLPFMLDRFFQVKQSFWLPHVSLLEFGKLTAFWGTGTYFRDHYGLALLLNIPFIMGFVLSIPRWRARASWLTPAAIVIVPVLIVFGLSFPGSSVFLKKYFIFALPLYLALALEGWLGIRKDLIRRLGLIAVFSSLVMSLGYYYLDYYEAHKVYLFIKPYSPTATYDGHAVSETASYLRNNLQSDEVVIYYSNPWVRSFSFLPSIYYNRRVIPEYLYSRVPLPDYLGQQYLKAGDRIASLRDFKTLPQGIWVVSLDSTEEMFNPSTNESTEPNDRWWLKEDLPGELREAGFTSAATFRRGRITVIHFRRSSQREQNS